MQAHDYNADIAPSGLFWTIRVPDETLTLDEAAGTAHVSMTNVPVVDSFQILSGTEVPAMASFDITWTATGAPRQLRPGSSDPLDPTNLAGQFKDAVATGNFSASSVTEFGSTTPFSFTAFAASAWGEMGHEQNGSFLNPNRGGRGGANP